MTCPRCGTNLVQIANLAKEPFEHTLLCDCGYSEPATTDADTEKTLSSIKEYWVTAC